MTDDETTSGSELGPETGAESSDRTLTMRRSFDVSPERVFDAWVDPNSVREWLFTSPETNRGVEVDAHVGSTYTITDRRGGEEYTAVGEYEEIDRPDRLVFTFAMPQFSPERDRITVEIEPDDGGCVLTFTQEGRSWPPEHAADYERESEKGWVEMFDALAVHLEEADR